MENLPTTLIAIVGLVAVLVLLAALVTTRYKVAGPNEAFIITGRKGKEVRNPETGLVSTDLSGQKVVMGGGVFELCSLCQCGRDSLRCTGRGETAETDGASVSYKFCGLFRGQDGEG